jgi:hypothetical protein
MPKRIWTILVFALAILLFPQLGQAQSPCAPFKAIMQWAAGPDPYHGPAYAVFDGQALIDEDANWLEFATETCSAGTCSGRGGKLLLEFGNGDSLTLTVQHGTYTPAYTAFPGFGVWHSILRIIDGTGRFLGASGALAGAGPWVIWIDATGFHGRFNGEFEGNVCIGRR